MPRKKWENMSRRERRVAVARDVIKQIQLGMFGGVHIGYGPSRVTCNAIADSDSGGNRDSWEYEDQEFAKIALESKECHPCVIGTMLLCKVAKYNHGEFPRDGGSQFECIEGLSDCFSEKQLKTIESYFEIWACDQMGTFIHIPAWMQDMEPEDRLLCIMQIIIDNDGEFKPRHAQEYEVVLV